MQRRDLTKVAAGVLTGSTAANWVLAKETDADFKWDESADVVIVGFGGAGAAAAIEAHDAGAKWNQDIAAGRDTLFDRPVKNSKGAVVSEAFDNGPYYALELVPALLNTQGGPRRNAKGQVLNTYGEVIPHLYVAGELGSMWGHIYQGACNNAEALVFGRLAGRAAAAEEAI